MFKLGSFISPYATPWTPEKVPNLPYRCQATILCRLCRRPAQTDRPSIPHQGPGGPRLDHKPRPGSHTSPAHPGTQAHAPRPRPRRHPPAQPEACAVPAGPRPGRTHRSNTHATRSGPAGHHERAPRGTPHPTQRLHIRPTALPRELHRARQEVCSALLVVGTMLISRKCLGLLRSSKHKNLVFSSFSDFNVE